jgi:hypothetical protein
MHINPIDGWIIRGGLEFGEHVFPGGKLFLAVLQESLPSLDLVFAKRDEVLGVHSFEVEGRGKVHQYKP